MLINALKIIQEDEMIVNRDVNQFGAEGYLLHSLEIKEGILADVNHRFLKVAI